ncbi:homocysteine S-methyltransferase [Maritimibacter sp. 55A14]|uniref:homocysteine S-methyltransferase family protein n=1 Tax=Maritimibacter sp. 55A14 TaxID=2174844 RepID=UPI000D60DD7B|nr:homocysteine S-methyltransferase family protein [Maritimibacter sp. 55A14]PWE29326.1 homocysteine S-methyltransferase [Maritimibacter sp. 55A14]
MSGITLLDGGMGQELLARSGDAPTPLWATQVVIDRPGLVADIHRAYFEAGAQVATTNTYALHRDRLVRAGIEDRFEALIAAALDEAEAARDAAPAGTRIAGSIGPLVASYRPETHPPHAKAVERYAELAGLLAPRVDFLLCETVASLDHARAVLEGAARTGLPVWLSVTVDDEDGSRLRSGEAVADAVPVARDGAAALLANCSAPEAMPAALDALARGGLPFGAYANGFTQITKEFLRDAPTTDALHKRRDMGPDAYAGHVMDWIERGATIVGGCCEVGPAHIREIARRIAA